MEGAGGGREELLSSTGWHLFDIYFGQVLLFKAAVQS